MKFDLTADELNALGTIGDGRQTAWLFADDPVRRDAARSAIEASGQRLGVDASLDTAFDRLADRPFDAVALVELDADETADEARLLERIDGQARDANSPAVVSFPIAALDRVSARLAAPHVTLLCDPGAIDRTAALELARGPLRGLVAAQDTVKEAVRLQRLADEVARIARSLAELAEPGGGEAREAFSDGMIGYRVGPVVPRPEPEAVRADDIRTIIRLRRQRDRLFSGDLFADPAWDMMLDLMAARIERLRVAVSSLCIAAAVPPTTALRWIKTLTDIGIFVRVADPTDGRRVFIELSDGASRAILNFLGEAKRSGASLV